MHTSCTVTSYAHPDVMNMVEHIYKQTEQTKENYQQIDAQDDILNIKWMNNFTLNGENSFIHTMKSTKFNFINKHKGNNFRLIEPKYKDSRITAKYKQSGYSKLAAQKYNKMQKPRFKSYLKKPSKSFTKNYLKIPEYYLEKRPQQVYTNYVREIHEDNQVNLLRSTPRSKEPAILRNLLEELPENDTCIGDNYTYSPSELTRYVLNNLPRFSTNLTRIKPAFRLDSDEYIFVSNLNI